LHNNDRLDVSYMNEIKYFTLKYYMKIGEYFLCSDGDSVWISELLITDFIFENVKEPKLISFSKDGTKIYKSLITELNDKIVTDLMITDYPKKARFNNLISINPLN